MRIVEYGGVPVKRQKQVGTNHVKVVFFDREWIIVTLQEWVHNRRDRFFDDPAVRRRDVIRSLTR